MKKVIIVLLLLAGAEGFTRAQIPFPYYDAIELKKFIDPDDQTIPANPAAYAILAKYLTIPNPSMGDIDQAFNGLNNPFIQVGGSAHASTPISREKQYGNNAMANVDVTNFSRGLSLFLIDRARQELNIAFFQRIRKAFEKYPEVRLMFPNTSETIVNLLEYQYNELLPALQEAFTKDMKILPEGIVEVLLMDKYSNELKKHPEFYILINTYRLVSRINQFSPPQFISALPRIAEIGVEPDNPQQKTMLKNLKSTFALSSIFSGALLARNSDTLKGYWVNAADFNKDILSDSIAFRLFMGLVYQQIKNNEIRFDSVILADCIKSNAESMIWYSLQISKFTALAEKMNQNIREIRAMNENNQSPDAGNIYNYTSLLIDISDFGFQFARHFRNSSADNTDLYIQVARETNELYLSTVSGKYALAMNHAMNVCKIIGNLSNKNGKRIIDPALIHKISMVGTFIANVADAETPEQVKAAIDAVALPAGSSSFKKYNPYNIAINGYLGASYNLSNKGSAINTWDRKFNLSAPVGIAFTFSSLRTGGSFSLFASILDVGAIVNYQLTDSSRNMSQKIYLSNILSPGAYLVYGFGGNIPLSIGIGGQYGPGLVKVGSEIINPSWRWNAFLAVDIPIVNIWKGKNAMYNKWKNYKKPYGAGQSR